MARLVVGDFAAGAVALGAFAAAGLAADLLIDESENIGRAGAFGI
jgi:hypothetical protein